MRSPLNHNSPAPVAPRHHVGSARLAARWLALGKAFPTLPKGEARSGFVDVSRSEPRAWPGDRLTRHLGAAANSARALPLDARTLVRARGDAVLDELRAQWHQALPLPCDEQAPPLVPCARAVLREAAEVTDAALEALSDGALSVHELDVLEREATQAAEALAFLRRRVNAERARLLGAGRVA